MNIPDIAFGAVVGAIIGAVVAILTLFFKDFLIPLINENRAIKNNRKETFRRYANPIALSAQSLLYRLREVFERGNFLLADAPKNTFNNYKFLSTMYRLCNFIGWIRAAELELSFIEVNRTKDYRKIKLVLEAFKKSLADGQHVEAEVLNQVVKELNIQIGHLQEQQRQKMAIAVEGLIHKHCHAADVEFAKNLQEDQRVKLAVEVSDLICKTVNCTQIPELVIQEKVQTLVYEMSRTEALIYRDWQSAIGDLMLKRSDKDSIRKYEVIGYKEFESLCSSKDADVLKWLKRVEKVFFDLNVSVENRYDDRASMLREVYTATYNILQTISTIHRNPVDISDADIKKLRPY